MPRLPYWGLDPPPTLCVYGRGSLPPWLPRNCFERRGHVKCHTPSLHLQYGLLSGPPQVAPTTELWEPRQDWEGGEPPSTKWAGPKALLPGTPTSASSFNPSQAPHPHSRRET